MKKIMCFIVVLVMFIGCAGKNIEPMVPQRVIVAFDWGSDMEAISDMLQKESLQVVKTLDVISTLLCNLTPVQQTLVAKLLPVRFIEPDFEISILDSVNAMTIQEELVIPTVENIDWGMVHIGVPDVWSITQGRGVRIGVIDTGIQSDHPDLVGCVVGGVDCVDDNINSWLDDNGHGTSVATVIGARKNGVGIVGVAPLSYLYSIKVLNSKGSGYISAIIEGYKWALQERLDVVNMSLGSYSRSQAMEDVMMVAARQGMATCAASGNDGRDGECYPARSYNAVIVGATGADDKVMSWSNYGAALQRNGILAPGDWVLCGNNDGTWRRVSGTSIATPHITGLVALLLELDWCERRFIFASGTNAGKPTRRDGYGLVNVPKTVDIVFKEREDRDSK